MELELHRAGHSAVQPRLRVRLCQTCAALYQHCRASTLDPGSAALLWEEAAGFHPLPGLGALPGVDWLNRLTDWVRIPELCEVLKCKTSEMFKTKLAPALALLDPAKLLHGEHRLQLHRDLAPADCLTCQLSFPAVLDKGRAAVMV